MTGLELAAFLVGAAILVAGIWHTTAHVVAIHITSLWRWIRVYVIAVAPYVVLGGGLVWLGSGVTR